MKSAARGIEKNYQHYYNAMRSKIREIAGIEIKYRPVSPRKAREERKRTHISEHEQDILNLTFKRGGKLCVKQTKLAELLDAPLRSIKAAIKNLTKATGVIIKTIQRGRRSVTIILLQKLENKSVHTRTHSSTAPGGGAADLQNGDSAPTANLLLKPDIQLFARSGGYFPEQFYRGIVSPALQPCYGGLPGSE